MKTFKTVLLGVAMFFGGLFALAFLIGFAQGVWEVASESSKPEVAKVETKAPASTPAPKDDTKVSLKSDKYEEVLPNAKTTFVGGCTGEGSSSAECGCMYDWLDDNLTNTEFGIVIAESVDGRIPDAMWSAAKACVAN